MHTTRKRDLCTHCARSLDPATRKEYKKYLRNATQTVGDKLGRNQNEKPGEAPPRKALWGAYLGAHSDGASVPTPESDLFCGVHV
jgi:hypothetical protein